MQPGGLSLPRSERVKTSTIGRTVVPFFGPNDLLAGRHRSWTLWKSANSTVACGKCCTQASDKVISPWGTARG